METITCTGTNEQQAANAALAALAAAGNSFALGQLWEINRGLLHRLFWKWYGQHQDAADAHGLTIEDLEQEGFFAVKYAADHYDPEKDSFATFLTTAVRKRISDIMRGEHIRRVIGEDGREVQVSANPLNGCTSLDAPLSADDDGSASLADVQPDPAAAVPFQAAEDRLYNEELHAALEEALNKLAEREAKVIRRYFWKGQPLAEIAAEEGVSTSRIGQDKSSALRKLARNPRLRRWHDGVISTKAWGGTGWNAWTHGGSVEERTVEYLERLGLYDTAPPKVEETRP